MASTKPERGRRLKPAGRLAAIADATKTPSLILGDVKKHLLAKHSAGEGRREDIVHPSEMSKSDWCPRQTYYRLTGTEKSDSGEKYNFYLENIYDEGDSIHDKWQSRLAEMGRLWGDWICRRCDTRITNTATPQCPNCGAQWPHVAYAEIPLSYEPTWKVAGHADGIDIETRSLIEIKSVGVGTIRIDAPALLRNNAVKQDGKTVYDYDGIWKGLRRPFPAHVRQANIYLWMAQQMGLPADQAVFIYEFKANQQVKEFLIPYSDKIMEPIRDTLKDLDYAIDSNHPPSRPAFTGIDKKICIECPYFSTCYKENDGKNRSPDSEHNVGTGRSRARSKPQAGTAGDPDAPEAGLRGPRTSGRPHRSLRLPVDVAVQPIEQVGRVHGSPVGSSGGRRAVRRKHPRQEEGSGNAGDQ